MKISVLCICYIVGLTIITSGVYFASVSLSEGTLWKGDYQCDKSSVKNSCLEALHSVQNGMFVMIGVLDILATFFFIIKLDMDRREQQNYTGVKQ